MLLLLLLLLLFSVSLDALSVSLGSDEEKQRSIELLLAVKLEEPSKLPLLLIGRKDSLEELMPADLSPPDSDSSA